MASVIDQGNNWNWIGAMSIHERLRAMSASCDDLASYKVESEQALKQLKRWKLRPPFDDNTVFKEWLINQGIEEKTLISVLSLPHIQQKLDSELISPIAEYQKNGLFTKASYNFALKDNKFRDFLTLVLPIMAAAEQRLEKKLKILQEKEYCRDIFDIKEMMLHFKADLENSLTPILLRTCILELNVERINNNLHAKTAEDRFQEFISKLGKNSYREKFFSEYPVLLRTVQRRTQLWIEHSFELTSRIVADYDLIKSHVFSGQDLGSVKNIFPSQGDSHCGNRTVSVISFSSGNNIVYKPRPLEAEKAFQGFLQWCNTKWNGGEPKFLAIKVLSRPGYGWMEFIPSKGCRTEKQIERFYWRQGAYLALFYLFCTTDMHFENIIAHGEHPVFVDLESLAHPSPSSISQTTPDKRLELELPFTVNLVGLLPKITWSDDKHGGGVDLSGLRSVANQKLPFEMPYPVLEGTDKMHMEAKAGVMGGAQNIPSLNGREAELYDYRETLLSGFDSCYKMLLTNKLELLFQEGPIANFQCAYLRKIFRPTQLYAGLISDSRHPDYCRDASERDRHWAHLWSFTPSQPWQKTIIESETLDLNQEDIPYFSAAFDSCDLMTSRGEKISQFFNKSAKDLIYQQIDNLSEQDLKAQSWMIDASFKRTNAFRVDHNQREQTGLEVASKPAQKAELINEAIRIGDRLGELAIQRQGNPYWAGLQITESNLIGTFSPGMTGLYNGELGIALFLGLLAHVTQESRFKDLMYRTLAWIRESVKSRNSALFGSGAYSGFSGYVYVLSHLGRFFGDQDLINDARSALGQVEEGLDEESSHSLIGGASSAVLALESSRHIFPPDTANRVIEKCCRMIAQNAVNQESGIGWFEDINSIKPLTGFSHGTAGYAAALMIGGTMLDNKEFINIAWNAITYERNNFSRENANWIDFRSAVTLDAPHEFMTAWCHGAPGIALSRIRMLPFVESKERKEEMLDEIRVAAKTCMEFGIGHNHSLCHGDLGNLDFLLQASRIMQDETLERHVYCCASSVLENMRNSGWKHGIGSPGDNGRKFDLPGLMIGIAGTGAGLLRLAQPNATPNILALNGIE